MKASRVLCAYVLTLFVCLPVFSQLNSGSINGWVADPTGAVIPGVTVTVTDVERGVSRTLLTDEAGQYLATSLTPGTYLVRAELTGFQTVERKNIVVGVGQGVRVDVQLQTGAQTEAVTVSESVPLVDTSNEVISNTSKPQSSANCLSMADSIPKSWTSSPESWAVRAETHRTTPQTAPAHRAITLCWTE
jgi:hypothetical protein